MMTTFEPEFLDEVKNRLKLEYADEFCEVMENGTNILPRPTFVKDLACHICHHRKPEGIRFPCLNPSHVYCSKHMEFNMVQNQVWEEKDWTKSINTHKIEVTGEEFTNIYFASSLHLFIQNLSQKQLGIQHKDKRRN